VLPHPSPTNASLPSTLLYPIRPDLPCNSPGLNPRPAPRQQHILRLLNTNVKGGGKIMFALTEIKGVGRRYANLVCKKADVDLNKRCVRSFDVGGTERGV
jgi:hypothetical protein